MSAAVDRYIKLELKRRQLRRFITSGGVIAWDLTGAATAIVSEQRGIREHLSAADELQLRGRLLRLEEGAPDLLEMSPAQETT